MKKKVLLIICILFFIASYSFAESHNYLDSLIQEALKNNPGVEALEKIWQSKKSRIVFEKSLPQPQARFMYFGKSIQTKTGPQDRKYGLTQKVPFPSKLFLKGDIASEEAKIAYIKYLLGINKLVLDLKTSFYDYYFINRSLYILKEEKMILTNMHKTVQRRYENKKESQESLVKINLEISKLEDKILSYKKQKRMLEEKIGKFLNRQNNAKISIPDDYVPIIYKLGEDKNTYMDRAFKNSPLILLDEAGIEKQRLKLSLAKQGYMPDFGIMADYVDIGDGTTNLSNDGEDAWMVGVSVSVPIWFWKINSDIESKTRQFQAEENRYKDKKNFLKFKIEDVWFKINTNLNLVDLYKNVMMPQAKQNFSTSRISYEVGQSDFLDWLDAERNLISIKMAAIRQEMDYKKYLAQLEYYVGERLE